MSLTVRQVADRFGVTEHTVIKWIRNGELKAINVGVRPGKLKPRYRISDRSLSAFEELRSVVPPTDRARRRKSQPADIIQRY